MTASTMIGLVTNFGEETGLVGLIITALSLKRAPPGKERPRKTPN